MSVEHFWSQQTRAEGLNEAEIATITAADLDWTNNDAKAKKVKAAHAKVHGARKAVDGAIEVIVSGDEEDDDSPRNLYGWHIDHINDLHGFGLAAEQRTEEAIQAIVGCALEDVSPACAPSALDRFMEAWMHAMDWNIDVSNKWQAGLKRLAGVEDEFTKRYANTETLVERMNRTTEEEAL